METTLTRWVKHFSGGLERVRPNDITVQAGIKDVRLHELVLHVDEKMVLAIVSKMIEDFTGFFNFQRNMKYEQILDTSELILSDYNDISLMALADCFKMIKLRQSPFDKDMFQSLDGAKILEFLKVYRGYQENVLFPPEKPKIEEKRQGLTTLADANPDLLTKLIEKYGNESTRLKVKSERLTSNNINQ